MKKLLSAILIFTGAFMYAQDSRLTDPPQKELQFIGYSFTRFTGSNITPTNDILQGQVIGRLFGQNSTSTVPKTALYAEQRFVPMFIYKPSILDGYATFRGLFKIDYTWGDQAYGVGNNRGGGLNGGQINLQTLMANVEIKPDSADWNIVIGLQRIFDNVKDPNVNALGMYQNSAYKLSYWGTQGVGISYFKNLTPESKLRLGVFQLWENIIAENDDVVLWMADYERRVTPLLEIGADLWYMWDRGKNAGGISVLGQGLASALSEYNGALRIKLPQNVSNYHADLGWIGGHFTYNREFMASRWWLNGYVMANLGKIDSVGTSENAGKIADVFGVSANLSVNYKFGQTANDRISAEVLFTTGDENGISDGTLNSVITGNVYGSPVGIYSSHRALLLFPDPQVVNRYYSAVHDISNMGLGVTAAFLSYSQDLIPNKLTAKAGVATAISNISPKGGESYIGTEFNFEIKYNFKVFLTWGLSAGYLAIGDFYNAPSTTYFGQKPENPWVIFSTLSWLMF